MRPRAPHPQARCFPVLPVGGPGPLEVSISPGLRFHVVRPRTVSGAVEGLPMVDAHTGTDGAAATLGVPTRAGAGEVDHASFSSGRVGSVRAVITAWARTSVAIGSSGYRARIASATRKRF